MKIALLEILGPVSPEAERVVFDLKGTAAPVEAELFPIPDRFLGPARSSWS